MWEEEYKKWREYPALDPQLQAELAAMTPEELTDAFYRQLEFGTAGMRGIMGPGSNRMNIYTIRKVNTGYARYIEKQGEKAQAMGVAIAYDNRHNSYRFAMESAKILASHDIKVYVFSSLRPTPELSFTVRTLGCFGGIVCTASHNPKEYNGYKLYDQKGCQLVPGLIAPVIAEIQAITDELAITVELSAAQEALINIIDQALDDKYLETIKTIQFHPQSRKDIKIVFTPQHGTSRVNMCRLFEETGYDYVLVAEQADPDPDFTNTIVPNPEDPRAYILALEYARKNDADIVLSTDPDADRMGVQVKHDGDYVFLSGNQTGAVILEYLCHNLKEKGELPSNGIMISTVVTNDLGNVIAEDYGLKVVLSFTGFKFIGEKIAEYCDGQGMEFVFGYEESYGSIIKDFVRDKDSLQACLILAEAANYYKKQGLTLLDVVNELYDRYGYYYDQQQNIMLPGADGLARLQEIMAELRHQPPQQLGGLAVTVTEDYQTLIRQRGDKQEPIDGFIAADVLKYFLADGSWVAVRPSGTEPKCKLYYCVIGENRQECLDKTTAIKASLAALIKEEL